ncbi:unnamed protein product [Rhodiola kirilowii]
MGCFLACLGSSKDKKGKRRQSNKIPAGARDQRRGYNPVEQVVYPYESFKPAQQVDLLDEDVKPAQEDRSLDERKLDSSTSLVSVLRNKAADEFSAGSNEISQLESSPKKSNLASLGSLSSREKSADRSSSGAKKKVSFNSVVKTYEPVPTCELLDEVLQREGFSEKEEIGAEAQPSKSKSISESGSNSSSLMSYPPNHRYQNCRESDDEDEDEDEELDYEESDMDFDDDDDEGIFEESEYSDGEVLTDSFCSMGSTTKTSPEVNSNRKTCDTKDSSLIARGREGYDHSVLNPVENLSQWKALKSIGKPPPQQPQKENSALDFKKPPAISFSHEPKFNQAASLKSKMRQHQTQQMAVDASLSNWLMSPEPPRKSNASTVAFHNVIPQQTASQGSYSSYSPNSLDDRPILGALTVEEIKLISRNSSPRKSPSKSPDDMAIIGSVGSYWSNEKSDKDSSLVSSHKGIPNTTSKYREDMRVNWDSTPFETRLEKALSEGSAEA